MVWIVWMDADCGIAYAPDEKFAKEGGQAVSWCCTVTVIASSGFSAQCPGRSDIALRLRDVGARPSARTLDSASGVDSSSTSKHCSGRSSTFSSPCCCGCSSGDRWAFIVDGSSLLGTRPPLVGGLNYSSIL
jgi:hypothetical protein